MAVVAASVAGTASDVRADVVEQYSLGRPQFLYDGQLRLPAGFEHFGYAVAMDRTHVLVGSPGTFGHGEDPLRAADFTEAAFLYDRITGNHLVTFANETQDTAPLSDQQNIDYENWRDSFGGSVALLDDGRIAVGAYGKDKPGGNDAGEVYLFEAPLIGSVVGAPDVTIQNPNASLGDEFGHSLAAVGNGSVLVGAPGQEWLNPGPSQDPTEGPGAAYLFDRQGALIQTFQSVDGNKQDEFGKSVAAHASMLLVGAYLDDRDSNNPGLNTGRVYTYQNQSGTYVDHPDSPIESMSPVSGSSFGWTVAANDQFVLIGAPTDSVIGARTGAAYLFDHAGNQMATLAMPAQFAPNALQRFGFSVALVGDYAVVGATLYTGAGGGIFIFNAKPGTGAMLGQFEEAILGEPGGQLGWSLGGYGRHLVSGSEYDDLYVHQGGTAYVYTVPTPSSCATFLVLLAFVTTPLRSRYRTPHGGPLKARV
ncbi:MAG: hypothetical protein CMJ18_19895 [Phycisphaeraceae bacterium]|nr:hypothetical protein [Phycisphaeraceae bacterium]